MKGAVDERAADQHGAPQRRETGIGVEKISEMRRSIDASSSHSGRVFGVADSNSSDCPLCGGAKISAIF